MNEEKLVGSSSSSQVNRTWQMGRKLEELEALPVNRIKIEKRHGPFTRPINTGNCSYQALKVADEKGWSTMKEDSTTSRGKQERGC